MDYLAQNFDRIDEILKIRVSWSAVPSQKQRFPGENRDSKKAAREGPFHCTPGPGRGPDN